MRNVAHSLGLGRDEALGRLLRACGMDETYITGGASDYDKFLALAEAMPLCAGHPLRASVEAILRETTGISAHLCPHTARDFWRAWTDRYWYGDLTPPPHLPPVCPHCTPCEPAHRLTEADLARLPDPPIVSGDNLETWTRELEAALEAGGEHPVCRLPEDYTFVRPDPYHAGEAIRKRSDGGALTPHERDLLWTQALRVWGLASVRRGDALMLLQDGAPAEVVALLAYLDSSRALPRMVWIPSSPLYAEKVSGLYARVRMGVDLSSCATEREREERLTSFASVSPLGMAVAIES